MNNKLKWIHTFIMKSFINGIPLYFLLSFLGDFIFSKNYSGASAVNSFLGFCLFWWLFAGVYFFITIIVSKHQRENIFSWFMRFKERDEREEAITAHAAKSSFLLMAGIIFVSFFVSTTRFGYTPSAQADKYHGQFTVGHFDMRPHSVKTVEGISQENNEAYSYKLYDFPLSTTGMLSLFLLLQFGAFRFFSLRYNK
ncbi:MAG: hypothetical protein COW00_03785 [Bdellovibrio sp. CG12_big_fil_rev_8_21_14_0_65_39_13]|nr:MAG: hypothetical protein COW78_14650 [Bdellovibrio sp. CG22_combo_CG10-13_8_21_14_all_39_27]PIQ61481.1 MAG: hypothetical protein COW00_03785 [Bdellovibrio sp. CG12_big_fil_rev_8_21_14_0_65_39_13]PIR35327.1 MAG: hypothetical protein COV37_09550 [Bdellovibrio sp. CG11_big_fil_rev_8_21_14_0_20_39_38]PJB53658.1 MAG: hypothetical protein CO099_06000 [Bdellovibrio sp. CG_4_9_14_3_um_filter_39_7]